MVGGSRARSRAHRCNAGASGPTTLGSRRSSKYINLPPSLFRSSVRDSWSLFLSVTMLALSLGKLTLFLSTLSAAYSAPTLTSLSSSRANSSSILSSEALNTTTVASSSTQLITTTASSAPSSSSTPITSVQLNLTSSTQSPSFTTLLASTSTQSSNLTSTSTTTSVQSTQTLSSDLTTIRDRHISISISALNASLVANISSW